jgi:iron complex outermembrane receptor protein
MARKLSIVLAFAASFFQASAQVDKNATAPRTLPELAVEAKPIKELNWGGSAPIDGSQVENRGIGSISDLSGIAPNFYVNSNGMQSYGDVITMRGIGNTQLFGDPAVILYIDGVPAGSASTYSSALFDLESVEVLPGFQGHRFGKNAPGGVINVKTRRPGDTHRSKLFASYGSFNTQNYRILADGPMSNSSSYYFGLNRSSSDGFADNLNPAGNDATSESLNGRLGFNWKTEGGLEIGIGGTWEEFELGAQPIVHRNSTTGFYKRNSDQNEIGKIESNSQYLSLAKETNFGRVRSITSRNDWSLDPNLLDLNYADAGLAQLSAGLASVDNPISSTSKIEESREQWSEELTFAADPDKDNQWMLGLFMGLNEADGKADRNFPMPTEKRGETYLNTMLPASSLTTYQLDNESYAFYGNAERKLSDATSIDLGLRLDYVRKEMKRGKVNSFAFGPLPSPDNSEATEDYLWFTPALGLNYEIKESFNIFVKTAFSGKPGGFSPYVDPDSGMITAGVVEIAYGKERIWSNEVGVLLGKPTDNYNLGLSLYWNEISDYQFEKPSGGFDYFVDNAEEAEIKGLEVDFTARPVENWTFSATYGLSSGEIKKHSGMSYNTAYDPFGGADPATAIAGPHNFAGKDIPFTPEHTLSASLTHQLTDNLNWGVGVRNIGKIHYLDQTATDTVNDSYTLLDASISYERNGWGVGVFGTNLTDEEYYSSLVSSLTGSPGIVGSPRVIGLSLSKEF